MNTGDRDRLHEELIAYLEGELPPEDRARMESEVESSSEVRTELAWLRAAYEDIEAVERDTHPATPPIHIVDEVMSAVKKTAAPAEIVSLDRARTRRMTWWSVAAAAALIAVAAYVLFRFPETSGPKNTGNGALVNDRLAAPTPVAPPEKGPGVLADSQQRLEQQRKEIGHSKDADKQLALTAGPRIELPEGVSDVIATRRDAATSGDAMDKLLKWARLPKTDALSVATAPDASPEAMLGAARSLSGDEQRQILLTAIGKLQQDPNARLQLARNFAETHSDDPAAVLENRTQAALQLDDIKQTDPGNALPYYYEAKLKFDAGDTQGALSALQAAEGLSTASAYTLESALAQSEALKAGGMEPDAARMVAALTAGMEENNFLCQLAGDLLKYGQVFLSENDRATAEQIFKAVNQLGQQVEEGASFSQEQLAGMDIQRQALSVLGQLYTTVESADGVVSVTEATVALTARVQDLAGFFNALDELFLQPMTAEFWNMVSGIILGAGDLSLFNNPDVASATPSTTAKQP